MFKTKNYLIIFFVFLIAFMGVSIAADVNDSAVVNSDVGSTISADTSDVVNTPQLTTNEDNTIKENKNLKSDDEYTGIIIGQNNLSTYFDSNGNTTSQLTDGSNIKFTGEIDIHQNITIDKALNITADDDAIIKLNTVSGSLIGNETGNCFTINIGGSNSNITGLTFYNTQLFVKGASNVVLDAINVTVENQQIGSGVGVTSIRDGSFNITVANSTFYTENNGGSSTLVLADAQNCTIDNNSITAVGTVGNLVYLTTYNIATTPTVDSNSYNIIKNNVLNGPSTTSAICWAMVLTGHNNTIENNTINYAGVGITTQAVNIIDEDNFDNQISVNNTFINNRLNDGSSFLTFENATVIGNNFTGSVNIGSNSTIEYNKIPNAYNVPVNSTVQYNKFENMVSITSNTIFNYNNVTGTVTVNSDNNTLSYNNINDVLYLNSNNNIILYSNLTDIGMYNQATNNTIEYNHLDNLNLILNNENRISYNNVSNIHLYSSSSYNNITYNNVDMIELDSSTAYNNVTNNNVSIDVIDYNEGETTNIIAPNNIQSDSQDTDKNLKMDGIEYTTIVITNDNYNKYFGVTRTNGSTGPYMISSFNYSTLPKKDILLYFNESLNDVVFFNIQPNIQKSITITSNPDVTFKNMKIRISATGRKNITIVNSTFEYDTDFDPNLVTNYNNAAFEYNNTGANVFLDNLTFKFNIRLIYDEEVDDIVPINLAHLMYFNGNTTLTNSNINVSCYASTVDWNQGSSTYGKSSLLPFYKKSANNTIFDVYNNSFFFNTTQTYGGYPTTYGLDIHSTANVVNNNITMVAGEGWSYAVRPVSTNITAYNNVINVTGINYTAGFALENAHDCNIYNNTIIVNSSMDEHIYDGASNEYCAYALFINDYTYMGGLFNPTNCVAVNNVISNNHIIGNAYNTYAIEEFGGKDNTFANNTIEIPNSNTAMGIGAIGYNLTIVDNNITINGSSITGSTVDYLGAMTTGIYLARGGTNTVTGNNINSTKLGMYLMNEQNDVIENNTVKTDYENSIFLQRVNNSFIRNNYLESQELKGDNAVMDNKGSSNVIENNLPQVIKEYSLKVDTVEFTPGTKSTITASIYYGDENEQEIAANISKGKVIFKVDGKTLKDANGKVIYAKVINGTATIADYDIPTTWKENSTIQATYSGSTNITKMSSEKQNIAITQEEPTLTTEDINTTTGSTITLKATINTNTTVNSGKVVFKINGKTVKDANGKVIYAKVINNTVSVEYALPESYKVGSYNLTAVFVASGYDKLVDSKTLIIA